MNLIKTDRVIVSSITALLCLGVLETAFATPPTQYPLLSNSTATAPNVVFTLDDSGSMLSPLMPESLVSLDSNGNAAIQVLTPIEQNVTPATINSPAYQFNLVPTRVVTNASNNGTKTVSNWSNATPGSGSFTRQQMLFDAQRRSSARNTIYYNPEKRYLPWTTMDGTLMPYPAANSSGQWVVPLDPVLNEGTVNLSMRPGVVANTSSDPSPNDTFDGTASVLFCSNISNNGSSSSVILQDANRCASPTDTTTLRNGFHIASWYEFNSAGEARRISLNGTNSSGQVDRTVTFDRGVARTDCTSISATVRRCSWDQEMKNFATWFVYYRTRLLLSKGAVSKAFSSSSLHDFRLGYGALNNRPLSGSASAINVDGIATNTLVAGVRPFATAKANFYTWLTRKTAYDGTPLRRALGDVGEYFSRQGTSGSPWANDADLGTTVTSVDTYAGCRKSFHILTTDGYWSGGSTIYEASNAEAKRDVESRDGDPITGTNNRSYRYLASSPGNDRYKDNRSNMLADAAMYYWKTDLASNIPNAITTTERNPAFWQHLVNYTVGLGTAGNRSWADIPAIEANTLEWFADNVTLGNREKSDDLVHAAYNSRGLNLSVTDADSFAASLLEILQDITEQTYNVAGASVSSSVLSTGFAKYVPEYTPGSWTGNLSKYLINTSTGATIDSDSATAGIQPLWSAKSRLPGFAQRNIVVWKKGAGAVEFNTSLDGTVAGEMGNTPFAVTDDLVNYLRGDGSNEQSQGGDFRTRKSKLGDIVNSSATYVKNTVDLVYQTLPGAGASYRTFLSTLSTRRAVLFAGANDGMLHAFADEAEGSIAAGQEIFAFIPRGALPKLSRLASPNYDHQFYVDGQQNETHAHVNGGWKSLLIGSMGAGGKSVYAIDITSTTSLNASSVMWELNPDSTSGQTNALGHVFSDVEVGPIKVGGEYKWVALIGNGIDSTGLKAQLLVVDVSNGAILKTLDTGVGGTGNENGLGGVRAVRDSDGVIQAAYAGDIRGNVWRFNLSGESIASWNVAFNNTPLFVAKDGAGVVQPITAAPTLVTHPRGGVMVVVGTGKLMTSSDVIGSGLSQVQALYGLWDKISPAESPNTSASVITSSSFLAARNINLTKVSGDNAPNHYALQSSTPVNWSTQRGWTMPLTLGTGQRLVYPGLNYLNYVFVTTIVPPGSGSCSTGSSFSGLFDPLNGTVNNQVLFDTNGDGVINTSDTTSSWYASVDVGRRRLVSPPRQSGEAFNDCVGDNCPPPPPPGPYPCGPGKILYQASNDEAPKCLAPGSQPGSRTWRIITNHP